MNLGELRALIQNDLADLPDDTPVVLARPGYNEFRNLQKVEPKQVYKYYGIWVTGPLDARQHLSNTPLQQAVSAWATSVVAMSDTNE